jgi:hypothetical protein
MSTTFSASWEFQAAIKVAATGIFFFCVADIRVTRRIMDTIVETLLIAASCSAALAKHASIGSLRPSHTAGAG